MSLQAELAHILMILSSSPTGEFHIVLQYFIFFSISVCTYVCGLRHPMADLRQRTFPFLFMFQIHCLHVSDSDLRHPMSDLQRRFGREKNQITSKFKCMLAKYWKGWKKLPLQIGHRMS